MSVHNSDVILRLAIPDNWISDLQFLLLEFFKRNNVKRNNVWSKLSYENRNLKFKQFNKVHNNIQI